jgi:hypothetical protein
LLEFAKIPVKNAINKKGKMGVEEEQGVKSR